ncbi:MAG: outer membrane beta-barrel protein [Saprospiraceae bacterium]|nr:outer membrane beta-barrel protein [Saprospiraceae bacterium]
MKKSMISASLLFLSIGLLAQWTIAPNMGLGFSTSQFDDGDKKFQDDYVTRVFAGMQVGYGFSKRFGIGLAAQYAGKGYKAKVVNSMPLEFKYDYIEVIPFAEYKPFPFMGVVLGPSIGFLRGFSVKLNNIPIKNIDPNLIEDKEIGAVAGLKFYWKDLFLNLTFNRSIQPVAEFTYTDENGNNAGTGKEFNQSFRLGVGYNFHLKEK